MENQVSLTGHNSDQDEQEYFLGDFFRNPTNLSSQSEPILSPTVADGGAATGDLANSNDVVPSQQRNSETAPPTTCVLSFDKSTAIPAFPQPRNEVNTCWKLKPTRTFENLNDEPRVNRGTKKARTGAGALDHIMSERRRRQELAERFIALSATIPGLKKIDKASILSEAASYVKQLQERVRELENRTNKTMKESQVDADHEMDGGSPSSEINSNDCHTPNDVLPDVKARISENKQLLIRILCQKQRNTMLKILDEIKNLHLKVSSNSVIPFGSSTIDITIIAQMTEEFSLTAKDVVKSLKIALS